MKQVEGYEIITLLNITCFWVARIDGAVVPSGVGVCGVAPDPWLPAPGVPAVVVVALDGVPVAVGRDVTPKLTVESSFRNAHLPYVVSSFGCRFLAPNV